MRQAFGYGAIAFAAAALLGAGITAVTPATAQDKAAVVTEREDLMKSNGQYVYRVIPGYIRSGTGTPEDVAKGAATIVDNFKKIPALFVAGTSTTDMPGKTKAKPEIWQDKAKFETLAKGTSDLAAALGEAAKTGDKDKISAAYTTLNRDGCTACHNQFRAEAPRGG